jgi:hypothetical protein
MAQQYTPVSDDLAEVLEQLAAAPPAVDLHKKAKIEQDATDDPRGLVRC